MIRRARCLQVSCLLLLLTLDGSTARGQETLTGPELEAVVTGLEIQQDMDRRLLLVDRQRYSDLLKRRRQITTRLETLYKQLDEQYDRLIAGNLLADEAFDLQATLTELEVSLEQAETERDRIRQESWLLRDRMRDRGLRMTMLDARLGSLKAATDSRRGVLTGTWNVRLLPPNIEATFVLRQEGTIVSGRYRMGSDRVGSFTGTIIGNRVTLQQIDAKYGKDAVFFGNVTGGGYEMEGTWESLSLGTGRPSFGTFKAQRLAETEEQEEEAEAGQQQFTDPDRRTTLPGQP